MTLQQLRYFLASCQHGSFTAAANALYIAQPSLADQIRQLEAELGVKLFLRGGRQLTLTEAGRTVRGHAERALAEIELATVSVADVRELRRGTAALGTFGVAHHYFVREVVAEFARCHPNVVVRVVGQNSVEVAELVRRGQLEVGLITLPIDASGLDVRPVMSDEILFATTDRADTAQAMTIERLASVRFIAYHAHFGPNDPGRRQLVERGRSAKLAPVPAIEVETFEAALGLAAQSLGGTLVLRTVAEQPNFPAALRAVSFDPPLWDTYAFVSRRGTKPSPATSELMRLAEQQIERFGRPVLPPDATVALGTSNGGGPFEAGVHA